MAISDEDAQRIAQRLKALREAAGFTQEQVSVKSKGKFDRITAIKLEQGKNKASSDRVRSGLALAYGLDRNDISAYIDGEIALEDLIPRLHNPPPVAGPSLAVVLALNPGKWSVDVVRAVEGVKYAGGVPRLGWERALDETAEAHARGAAKNTGRPGSAGVPSSHDGDRPRAPRKRSS